MAATVSSSVWGAISKPGAWALEAEQHEDELRRDLESASATAALTLQPDPPSADFPTLAAAAATKTKKKKGQTLSLAEFSNYSSSTPKPSAADSQRLTADELLVLPTGPRQRSAEELERSRGGFGGGFRNYGYDSSNSRARVSERGAGHNGYSNKDRADEGLSRADEVDDWSKSKKYAGSNSDRKEKVGFFNSSRADEVDNWASNKSFTPTEGRRERRMGFDSSSNGADSDNWTRRKEDRDASNGGRFERDRRGLGFESSGAADSENWLKKKENNGGVVDGTRPRLNLQPRTLPINNSNEGQEVKPKGSNPFGDARPREEVLKEKGKDWKEIDEKLEAVKVKEQATDEAGSRRKGFGMGRIDFFKDDLMEKRSWRKGETENARPTTASADKVENGDVEKAEDGAAERTENEVA